MSDKPPYVCEASDQSTGRPATFIFIHGYDDDAEGIPLGMAQQFQYYKKLQYLRWLLPNAPIHKEDRARAWYKVRALPSSQKPRVPGHEDEEQDTTDLDDEEGILETCDRIDGWVKEELDRGVEPGRIIVGGFSQGCAVSLVWGLVGRHRDQVGGIFAASGYLPLSRRLQDIRNERGIAAEGTEKKKWLYVHGSRDLLVGTRYFEQGKQELKRWISDEDLEDHIYQGMGHSTSNAELRDLLGWLSKVIPP